MSEERLKITFADKSDSYNLNTNSKNVLTAENVNEIKRVVNSLADGLGATNLFSDMMRYVRFVVPDFIEGSDYDFILKLSTDADFPDDATKTATLSVSTDSQKFHIFKNDTWNSFTSLNKTSISASDKNASMKVDIKDILDSVGKTFYGRYMWVNNGSSPKISSEWKGVVLGSYAYFNEEFEEAAALANIVSFKVEGTTSVNKGGTGSYVMKQVNKDGTETTVQATFTSLYGNSFNGGTCTFNSSSITRDAADIIKGTCTINGVAYSAFIDVLVKVKTMEKILIGGLPLEMSDGDTAAFTVSAYYSDNSVSDVTNSVMSSSIKLALGASTLSGKTITAAGLFDLYGTVEVSYTESGKTCTDVKYIHFAKDKVVSLSTTLPSSISSSGGAYVVTATKKKGGTTNVTDNINLKVALINGEGVTLSGGTVAVDSNAFKDTKEVTAIFKYRENGNYNNDEVVLIKTFTVTSSVSSAPTSSTSQDFKGLKTFDVTFKQNNSSTTEIFENSSISYEINGAVKNTLNETIALGTDYTYEIINCNVDAVVSLPNSFSSASGTISFGNFHTNENVVLKFRVSYNSMVFERLFTILVKPVYPVALSISSNSNFTVDNGGNANVSINAQYSDGSVVSTNKNNRTISFAAGNPGILQASSFKSNSVILNDNSSSSSFTISNIQTSQTKEAATFLVEYKDASFPEETVSKMFTIVVNNPNA